MKKPVVYAMVAGSLATACAVAVLLVHAGPHPGSGERPGTPHGVVEPTRPSGQAAAIIRADKSPSPNQPGATTTAASDSKNPGAGRKPEPLDPHLWNPAEQKVRQRIADEVRIRIPEAVPLFIGAELPHLTPQGEVLAALWHTLEAAQSASPTEQPPLLLAADFLAEKVDFPPVVPPAPETQKKVDRLAQSGLSFGYDELAGSWIYSHDLLWRVRREFPDSPWVEDAFILLLGNNWDKPGCPGGADAFRAVIREGENFLATHPQARYRLETSYLVAQAYETWWSLSRAKLCQFEDEEGCEGGLSLDSYRKGADEARQQAISYYTRVLEIAPSGNIAADARRHLDDINQNLDTVQRRFYCPIED